MTEERKSSRWPLFRLVIPLPILPPTWRPWLRRKWPYIAGLTALSILLFFLIALEQTRAPELGLGADTPDVGPAGAPAGKAAPVTPTASTEEAPFPPEMAFAPAGSDKPGNAAAPGPKSSGRSSDAKPDATKTGSAGSTARTTAETMLRPVAGEVISAYGWVQSRTLSSETSPEYRLHPGVDLKAPEGTPVKAAFSGEVTFADSTDEIGLTVIISHGGGKETLYGNLSQITVKKGAKVARGETIARVGTSAWTESADPPHLHFELRIGDQPADPGIN